MNKILKYLSVVFVSILTLSCSEEIQKPNVIIIYTDDHNFEHIGIYGGEVLTPNIDRIANEGIRFNRFYVSSPVCTPSRYTVLTGRYAVRSKELKRRYPADQPAFIRWNTFVTKDDKTLAHILRDNGYATGMVGKWHLGPDWEHIGGTESYDDPGVKERVDSSYKIFTDYVKDVSGFEYVERLYGNNMHAIGVPKSMQYHNQEWITEGGIKFIEQNKNNPFFLYFATTLPHVPGPLKSLKADPRITAAGMLGNKIEGVQPSRENVFERTRSAGITDENSPMTWLDDGIGSILNKLEELKLLDNTIIVFASDHQSPRAKMTCYEDGANVPGMIMWKGRIKAGQINDKLVSNVDIAPTILDLLDIQKPERYIIDGKSWKRLLNGADVEINESIYLEVVYQRAVVTSDWKYIAVRFPDEINKQITGDNRNEFTIEGKREGDRYNNHKKFPGYYDDDQLYYLVDDKGEQNNLANDPDYADKLREMKNLLKEYSKKLPYSFGELN